MSMVKIPPVLRSSTGGEKEVSVEGGNVGEVLRSLAEQHPATEGQLFQESGELNRYDTLVILPAMAGGR
jgi:molybdopterin converting factor small subunit